MGRQRKLPGCSSLSLSPAFEAACGWRLVYTLPFQDRHGIEHGTSGDIGHETGTGTGGLASTILELGNSHLRIVELNHYEAGIMLFALMFIVNAFQILF